MSEIVAEDAGLRLTIEPRRGEPSERMYDRVVLATGHQWPEEPEVRPGYFLSPWPATALQRILPMPVGIRGSSLTVIDAAVALAVAHGQFIETGGQAIDYRVHPGAEDLHITMMSREGLLPEADFFYPIPFEQLSICTPGAVDALIASAGESLLDRSYDLFRTELAATDPDYAAKVGLDGLALEDFGERYFVDRVAADPFDWAERDLAEASENFAREFTVPWRYAILRMHEVLGAIVPHLDEESLDRLNRLLKPIFVDEYATVPHLSIERLLALHRAGHLDVIGLGTTHRINTHGAAPGAIVTIDGERRDFPAFIDATGQRPLAASAFPFQHLLELGVVRDTADDDAAGAKGIAVDDRFHPVTDHPAGERLFCLSIPFILERHPFIQGITSSHEMGEIVGTELAIAARAANDVQDQTETGGVAV